MQTQCNSNFYHATIKKFCAKENEKFKLLWFSLHWRWLMSSKLNQKRLKLWRISEIIFGSTYAKNWYQSKVLIMYTYRHWIESILCILCKSLLFSFFQMTLDKWEYDNSISNMVWKQTVKWKTNKSGTEWTMW